MNQNYNNNPGAGNNNQGAGNNNQGAGRRAEGNNDNPPLTSYAGNDGWRDIPKLKSTIDFAPDWERLFSDTRSRNPQLSEREVREKVLATGHYIRSENQRAADGVVQHRVDYNRTQHETGHVNRGKNLREYNPQNPYNVKRSNRRDGGQGGGQSGSSRV